MSTTLYDVRTVGLCIATEELFDARRFLLNFCDMFILRCNDTSLKTKLLDFKRELNSMRTQKKFFEGYKAVIMNNIDKILRLARSRYGKISPEAVDRIVTDGKNLVKKVLKAEDFEDISSLESEFRSKITLPAYKLFIDYMKRSNMSVL